MQTAALFIALALMLLPSPAQAQTAASSQSPAQSQAQSQAQARNRPVEQESFPPDLKAWQGWVLHGQEEALCPPRAGDPAVRECAFPARLSVQMSEHGAGFTMVWRVFTARNVPVPHAPGLWPAAVLVDGQPAAVLDDSGAPHVRLSPGEHQVAGALSWKRMPRFLLVPASTGLVELKLGQKTVVQPRLGTDGRLDLAPEEDAKAPEESFQAKVFRLISDGVPMTVSTMVRLEVSGRTRTIALDGLLPPGTAPMGVSSPVPVGFGPDGQVMAQAGAGRHDIEITSRFPGPVQHFGPAQALFGREIWAVRTAPELRDLQVKGLPAVDARTTDLPEAWKKFAAFQADEGARLELVEIRRGEAGPRGDDLHVKRTFWLDFDGGGLTARDSLTGTIRRGWSLAMSPPGELGRAATPAGDLPLVLLGDGGLRGVELREASVNLTAESRYPGHSSAVPATGWNADASSLSAEINLPPGWRVFDVAGPDSASHSWVSRWNLLNIFLTLFMVLGAFKLRGVLAGLCLLAFLALAQHEPGAPIEAWLPLLAALGLAKVFDHKPESWQRASRGARLLHWAALAAVALMSLAFAASQIRIGVYPQLEMAFTPAPHPAPVAQYPTAKAPATQADEAVRAKRAAPYGMDSQGGESGQALPKSSLEQDPRSLVQTGPGLPSWTWRQVRLSWNGPVGRDQTFRLVLLSPPVTSALCFARVAFLLAALALLADVGRLRGPKKDSTGGAAAKTGDAPSTAANKSPEGLAEGPAGDAAARMALLAVVLPALFAATLLAGPATAAEYPSKEILDEFRQRLLKPAECFPVCAGVSEMAVSLDGQSLKLGLTVGAATRLVLPLPVVSDGWRPAMVTVDQKPADLVAHDGALWVLLGEGAHVIAMAGPVPAGVSFSVSTPFPVRAGRAEAPGWSVLGFGPDGKLEGGLTFTRREESAQGGKPAMTAVIPPFLEVERILELGLSWEASTTVRRLTRTGEPVVVEVPLLPGESVLGQDVRVEGGKAVVGLAAGQRQASWRSRLDTSPEITLAAPEGVPWVESWRLSASPVWDVRLSGIPAVAALDAAGRWSPLWRPWPGEKVAIAVTRPAAAPGESLTIDSARLGYVPGKRLDAATLTLRMRTALGGRHVLTLPEKAEITGVSVAGRAAPWSSDKPGEIGLALTPGMQDIVVSWRQPRQELGQVDTPAVGLGHSAVNASVVVDMPRDRWILWASGDTPMRPAVLFWSAVGVCAVAALGLGFLPWTPLKRWQWFLLGLGLTQVELRTAVLAVAWLIALGARGRRPATGSWSAFNLMQAGLVVLTVVGLTSLFSAIHTGLLGEPITNITGNGSSAYHLAWTFDRVGEELPAARVFSVSLWWYRGLMLAWSLWMALSLLSWLRWGWEAFNEGGAWRKAELKMPALRKEKPVEPKRDEQREEPVPGKE